MVGVNPQARGIPVSHRGMLNGVYPGVVTAYKKPYTAYAQLAGVFFPVTVQASDMFGNFVGTAPNDTIELTTDGSDANTVPTTTFPITSPLNAGRTYFHVRFGNGDAGGTRSILPRDETNPNIVGHPDSQTKLLIAQPIETYYKVVVNGIRQSDNIPVYVEAWPSTFTVRVEVCYTGTGEIVPVSSSFILEPTLDMGLPPTPAGGTLGQRTGVTEYGVATFDASNDPPNPQTYSQTETIFIRVRNVYGDSYPVMGFSPEIRVSGNVIAPTPTPTPMLTPTPSATPTSTSTSMITSTPSATPTPTPGVSAGTGEVKAYQNLLNPLRSGQTAKILVNQGGAGRVTVRIYTTQGRLVRTLVDDQEFAAGSHTLEWDGTVLNGATAASGIYIAHVKAPGIDRYVRIAVVK